MKNVKITITDITSRIEEEISRVAAKAVTQEGAPLYDLLKLSSRDDAKLTRTIESRINKLNKRLLFCLSEYSFKEGTLSYAFTVNESFKDAYADIVGNKIRDYIVQGSLMDWYISESVPTESIIVEEVSQLERDILSLLRLPSVYKRPMQPFGPQNKYR